MMIPSCILLIEDESDREFMTQLYFRYQRLMYGTISKITTEPWKIEDILQTTLEKLIDKIDLLKTLDRNRLVNYIISTCKHNAYNALRYDTRYQEISFDDCLDRLDTENGTPSLEDRTIQKDSWNRLIKVWPELDTRSQYLLEARYILDKPIKEIAKELQIKPESVRMALTRARKNAYSLIGEKR